MKEFCIEWGKTKRVNCTVFIKAGTKEEALQKWHNGDYLCINYDEDEISIEDEDKVTLEDVKEVACGEDGYEEKI